MLLEKKMSPGSGETPERLGDRKSTRLNSSHGYISYAVFCLKKNKVLNYAAIYLALFPAGDKDVSALNFAVRCMTFNISTILSDKNRFTICSVLSGTVSYLYC